MTDDKDSKKAADFAAGAQEGSSGLMSEFFAFLKHNKKWWLLPMLVVLVLLGLLTMLAGTGAAPFIYTLF